MTSLIEAFASNPRYAPGGLEDAIDNELMADAKTRDAQAASMTKLESLTPEIAIEPRTDKSETFTKEMEEFRAGEAERQETIDMHDKILSVVDTATGPFRDVTAGMIKAADNTLAFVVGRENLDASNKWLEDNLPGVKEFNDTSARGMVPRGTISDVTQEMSQFMVPFGLYMKGVGAIAATKGITAGAFTKAAIADLVASGTAMNPHMERFSAVAKEMGVDNRIVSWLADNEDETESEGRLKNILDSAGAAATIAPAFITAAMTMKGLYRLGKRAKPKAPSKPVDIVKESPKPSDTPKPAEIPDITKQVERQPVLLRENLNTSKMIKEDVMVDGNVTTIERKAGQVLNDFDSRVSNLESALDEL